MKGPTVTNILTFNKMLFRILHIPKVKTYYNTLTPRLWNLTMDINGYSLNKKTFNLAVIARAPDSVSASDLIYARAQQQPFFFCQNYVGGNYFITLPYVIVF